MLRCYSVVASIKNFSLKLHIHWIRLIYSYFIYLYYFHFHQYQYFRLNWEDILEINMQSYFLEVKFSLMNFKTWRKSVWRLYRPIRDRTSRGQEKVLAIKGSTLRVIFALFIAWIRTTTRKLDCRICLHFFVHFSLRALISFTKEFTVLNFKQEIFPPLYILHAFGSEGQKE